MAEACQNFKNNSPFCCIFVSRLTPNATLSKASCVIVYNEDGAVNSAGFGPKEKKNGLHNCNT